MILIGRALGLDAKGEEIADFYRIQTGKVLERLEQLSLDAPRPKVYMEFSDAAGPDVFGSTYGKQMWGALIQQCGGDNIARELVQGANGTILPEQILAANPDIIIFAGNQFANSNVNVGLGYTSNKDTALKNLASYEKRPGWSGLSAVTNKKMYALYHDLSRHIFDVAGLQFIAKAIHPELFQDLNPDATLREFHERFYPVEYTGVWMIALEQ
jgi:iron complex transport system substrate-binding protein